MKTPTLFAYYKKMEATSVDLEEQGQDDLVGLDQNPQSDENVVQEDEAPRQPPPKVQRLNARESVLIVERDPGLRCQIWEYPVGEQDEARRIYHFDKDDYPLSGSKKHPRRFQSNWFKCFPWLEYSPAKMQPSVFHAICSPRNQLENQDQMHSLSQGSEIGKR